MRRFTVLIGAMAVSSMISSIWTAVKITKFVARAEINGVPAKEADWHWKASNTSITRPRPEVVAS